MLESGLNFFETESGLNQNVVHREILSHKEDKLFAAIHQKLSMKLGREVTQVETWVHTHRRGYCMLEVGTFSSTIREESPEDTLHRISHGVFGGPNNVTASGDGNYCLPEDEEFPLFPIHL
ncbi:hypothetical protein ACP70R_009278 [Stipagrostis hirtigluma subsp. patula]